MLEPVFSAISPLWALTNTVARLVLKGRSLRLSCPVISVGNIVAGGVGKTEIASLIANHLAEQGKNVVVASRGYGSDWQQKGGVAKNYAEAASLHFPDESLVLLKKAQALKGKVFVSVGANRAEILKKHWEEMQPDVVVLDDGFQHFSLARDLDVLVHDFSQPWQILRDLPSAMNKAGVRVCFSDVPSLWKKKSWNKVRYKVNGARDGHGNLTPLPKEALLFCGIGNPARFKQSVVSTGTKVGGFKTFRDHFGYNDACAKDLVRWQKKNSNLPLLTTLKDFVKLEPLLERNGDFKPSWVDVSVDFLEGRETFWKQIDEVVAVRDSIPGSQ